MHLNFGSRYSKTALLAFGLVNGTMQHETMTFIKKSYILQQIDE
jgi:hypothetical protein